MKDKFKGESMRYYLSILFIVFFTAGCTQSTVNTTNTSKGTSNNTYIDTKKAAIISNDFLTENALHDAVRANDLELVKFLIKQGAQVNKQDQYGFTPLHLAVRLHNLEITQYLISKNADVNTIDVYKDTPLLDSTRNDDTDISKELICNGAKRNVADVHHMSTLNNSSKNNNKYISMLLRADSVEPYCNGNRSVKMIQSDTGSSSTTSISINNLNDNVGSKPTICGTIKNNDIIKVNISLKNKNQETYGLYPATINSKQNTWCAKVTDTLANGKYDIFANGYKANDTKVEAQNKLQVYIIPGLYNALMNEFENDFEPWGANLDESTLTFSFNKESILFLRGKKDISSNYKSIIDDFFPRYIKIIKEYQDEIENIIIEGHSSSEHRLGKTPEEKYELNRILSDKRANEVLKYATNLPNLEISDNIVWIITTFRAEGLSSSQLIYNEDGSENKEASRRVDFRIQTKDTN